MEIPCTKLRFFYKKKTQSDNKTTTKSKSIVKKTINQKNMALLFCENYSPKVFL